MRTAWGLLCCLVGAIAGAGEVPLICQQSSIPKKYLTSIEDLATGALPIPDYQVTAARCKGGDPFANASAGGVGAAAPSAWLDAERARYVGILASQPADILVVPWQIQGYGIDRIERAVMAADLAYAIGDAGALKVADPFLTALALGEGIRQVDQNAVARLAEKIGARKILYAYVGHDLKHAFTLTLKLQETAVGAAAKPWQRDWRSIPFSNEKTPAYVFHDMLPAVLKELPLGLDPKRVSVARLAPTFSKITAPPVGLVAAETKSDSDIATMTLFAAMVPAGADLARERLFERALLTAIRAGGSKPEQRFFEAYALLNLQRRPVALARIEDASGQSFEALRALLDGNLPAAQSATRQVKNPLEQLLLQFQLRDLEYAYGLEEPSEPTAIGALLVEQVLSAWGPLLMARLEDGNAWFWPDARPIKEALDQAFPSKELGLEALSRGHAVARQQTLDEVDIDLANTRHARQAAVGLKVLPCCHSQDLRPSRWDLLWMLEAVALERINGAIERSVFIQGSSRAALATIDRYAPLFKGHPRMTALSAHAALRVAQASPDDERATWMARSSQEGRGALQWSPGQNRIAFTAALALGIPSRDSEVLVDVYGYDFPRRPDWPNWFSGLELPTSRARMDWLLAEALAFSTSDPAPVSSIPDGTSDASLAALGARFTGSPLKPQRRPSVPVGDPLAAARAAAQQDPNQNLSLGYQLLSSGRPFREALDAFLAYPAFQKRSARDRVALSNEAYEAGSSFFWLGQAAMAKPLFQIAADLDTGSDASMGGAQRLRLIEGDYMGAAQFALDRSRRYSNGYAQRDYLSLLHAFGEHDAAWSAFAQLRAGQGNTALWISAIVGHRMQKLDEAAVRAWLQSPEIRNAKFNAQLFASYFALMWSSIDRVPPADLGALVAELEGKPVARIDAGGLVMRPHPVDVAGSEMVFPTFVVPPVIRLSEGTLVKSERAYFADAYSAVVRAEYSKAVERFGAMARLYPADGTPMPYLAYAASKTGDTLQFENYVRTAGMLNPQSFDVLLARAFFAAGHKRVDEAYGLLTQAFRNKPNIADRLVDIDYQFAQACEWLYRDTKDARFTATLLDWARSYQTIQPTVAWSYAVQYQYDTKPDARIRALAMALHLDPLSDRISKASKADVAKARTWFAANNPFRIPSEEEQAAPQTAAAL